MRRILATGRFWSHPPAAMLITIVAAWVVPLSSAGQSPTAEGTPQPVAQAAKNASTIPPPRRFEASDPEVRRSRLVDGTGLRRQDEKAAQSVPSALALPGGDKIKDELAKPERAATTPPPPLRLPVDPKLIPGRSVEPIDLANVLRLAGARDLDIAIARQRILQAAADLKQARALWLPSLFYGPTWYRADGQIQTVDRPGPDDQPQLAVPGRHRGAGQLLPRPIAWDWLSRR